MFHNSVTIFNTKNYQSSIVEFLMPIPKVPKLSINNFRKKKKKKHKILSKSTIIKYWILAMMWCSYFGWICISYIIFSGNNGLVPALCICISHQLHSKLFTKTFSPTLCIALCAWPQHESKSISIFSVISPAASVGGVFGLWIKESNSAQMWKKFNLSHKDCHCYLCPRAVAERYGSITHGVFDVCSMRGSLR